MLPHLRIFQPHPNVLAFYDGRVPGYRFAPGSNWVDDGALSLGIASYAIVDVEDALVYDTHVSVPHAEAIRAALQARGVRHITVVLSHWHLDHIAGNAVFADCEIVSCARTAAHMRDNRAAIEAGMYDGPPAIAPLVLPARTFEDQLTLKIGTIDVELRHYDIHSDDGVVLWLPASRLLLAGDTLEDTVTYVAEPTNLSRHLPELDRLAALHPKRILPNHGCPERIASGGYGPDLIPATARYVRALIAMASGAQSHATPLRDLIAADLKDGALIYYPDYEAVHARNVASVTGL
jgi:glyoxylase-like metal-dependent hydrolase (beta-lactamase superfamily II)